MATADERHILSVQQLLQLPNISIPSYQRPYKWTEENVTQLFDDIQAKRHKSAYRLGTIVFHNHVEEGKERRDIVDGQQRTLTLVLAVKAIIDSRKNNESSRPDITELLKTAGEKIQPLLEHKFGITKAQQRLYTNYLAIERIVSRSDFTDDHIDFLLNKCEIVKFELKTVEEAFQFFDSQNARGRDLAPHDLLKAYHLREFPEQESALKANAVAHWENLDSKQLSSLFADYLFRIRQWSQGKRARYFTKAQVGLFKGINIEKSGSYPYAEPLRIAHFYVDDYNSQYQRKIDGQTLSFPFQLDQMILNGRRFFEMAEHYQQMVAATIVKKNGAQSNESMILKRIALNSTARAIVCTLNNYPSRNRKGDKYVRCLFDCALVFYIDKFGSETLSAAIEKIFVWAYCCRIERRAVQLATMDKHALKTNLFRAIHEAATPQAVLAHPLPDIDFKTNKDNKKLAPLIKQFEELGYRV